MSSNRGRGKARGGRGVGSLSTTSSRGKTSRGRVKRLAGTRRVDTSTSRGDNGQLWLEFERLKKQVLSAESTIKKQQKDIDRLEGRLRITEQREAYMIREMGYLTNKKRFQPWKKNKELTHAINVNSFENKVNEEEIRQTFSVFGKIRTIYQFHQRQNESTAFYHHSLVNFFESEVVDNVLEAQKSIPIKINDEKTQITRLNLDFTEVYFSGFPLEWNEEQIASHIENLTKERIFNLVHNGSHQLITFRTQQSAYKVAKILHHHFLGYHMENEITAFVINGNSKPKVDDLIESLKTILNDKQFAFNLNQVEQVYHKTRTIYVGNLPSKITQTEIREQFEKHVNTKIEKIALPVNENGEPKDFCFITFADVKFCKEARAINPPMLKGNKLKIYGSTMPELIANMCKNYGLLSHRGEATELYESLLSQAHFQAKQAKGKKLIDDDPWGIPSTCQYMQDPSTNRIYYIEKIEPLSHPATNPEIPEFIEEKEKRVSPEPPPKILPSRKYHDEDERYHDRRDRSASFTPSIRSEEKRRKKRRYSRSSSRGSSYGSRSPSNESQDDILGSIPPKIFMKAFQKFNLEQNQRLAATQAPPIHNHSLQHTPMISQHVKSVAAAHLTQPPITQATTYSSWPPAHYYNPAAVPLNAGINPEAQEFIPTTAEHLYTAQHNVAAAYGDLSSGVTNELNHMYQAQQQQHYVQPPLPSAGYAAIVPPRHHHQEQILIPPPPQHKEPTLETVAIAIFGKCKKENIDIKFFLHSLEMMTNRKAPNIELFQNSKFFQIDYENQTIGLRSMINSIR